MTHWNRKNKPLQKPGPLPWVHITHCVQLENYMLKLQLLLSSSFDHNNGCKQLFRIVIYIRFCILTACQYILTTPWYPWPQKNSILSLCLSEMRAVFWVLIYHFLLQVKFELPSTIKRHLLGLRTIKFSWNHLEIHKKSALRFSMIILFFITL